VGLSPASAAIGPDRGQGSNLQWISASGRWKALGKTMVRFRKPQRYAVRELDKEKRGNHLMSTFVLIHGACRDGSAWNRVIDRLEERGHKAYGPTVAGHGKGVRKNVSHAESTQSVVDYINDHGLTDIVLVGHSYGGTIIAKVAEAIPNRTRRLVFYAGIVLEDGETMLEMFPPPHREMFAGLAAASPDNTISLPFDLWRDVFINDADLQLATEAYARLSPEPFCQLLEPLDLKKFHTLSIPKSYLITTEDTVMPPGEWGWHPRMSSRLGIYRLVQMPGSHEVIFSNPVGLADKIIEAGRD
jgi:pimeloyl-ACP methyl ester carboxylesterase